MGTRTMATPYYQEGGITIYHGDCMEIMPTLAAAAISAVITDPPYGETSLEWDSRLDRWAQAAYPVVSESASLWCFGSFRMFYESDGMVPWKFAQDLVWEKHNGSGFHADRFKRVHEHVVQFYKGSWESVYKKAVFTNDATARTVRRKQKPPHMNNTGEGYFVSFDGGPRMMRSVIYARSCHGQAVHPTQKPVAILAPLIEYSCAPGALVLDPFMGSGSTLVACKAMGIDAIGIEVNAGYCEAAVRRLSQEFLFSGLQCAEARENPQRGLHE